jgi:hypothetical protein
MTLREFMDAPRMRTALAGLGVAVLVIGWALVHAIRPPALEAAQTAASPSVALLQLPPAPEPVNGDEVAANDIFSQNRKPGRNRYHLPGEKDATDEVAQRAVRQPVVLGTVVAPDPRSSFATVQMSGSGLQPKGLHVGENMEGYVVLGIVSSSVRFLAPNGDTVEVFRNR